MKQSMITDLPNEILPKIASYLSFTDKCQLTLTCHSLHRVIFQRCLYESLAICTNCSHIYDPIVRFKNPKFNRNQVKKLTLNLNRLNDSTYRELTTVFPNVTELNMVPNNENTWPFSVVNSLINWTKTITSIDMEKGYLQLMRLLETQTFRRLTYLSISPYIDLGGRKVLRAPDIQIMACLKNAPSLKQLKIFKSRVNLVFLEQIHQNCPVLQSLEFDNVLFLLNGDVLPKTIVKATTILKLNLTYDTVVSDMKCLLLDYIAAKYPNLYRLEFSTSLSAILDDLYSQIPDLDHIRGAQEPGHSNQVNGNTRNNQENRNQAGNTNHNHGTVNSNRVEETEDLNRTDNGYIDETEDPEYNDEVDDEKYDLNNDHLNYHEVYFDDDFDSYDDDDFDTYDDGDFGTYDDYDGEYGDEYDPIGNELNDYFISEFLHNNGSLHMTGDFYDAGSLNSYNYVAIDLAKVYQTNFASTCEAYKSEGLRLLSDLPRSLKILIIDTSLFGSIIGSLIQADFQLNKLKLYDIDEEYTIYSSEVLKADEQLKYFKKQKSLTTLVVAINCCCQSFRTIVSHSLTKLSISLISDVSSQSFSLNWVLSAFPSLYELNIESSPTTIAGNITENQHLNLKKLHILNCQTSQNLTKVISAITPHLEEFGWLVSDIKKQTGNNQNNKARERAHCNVDLTGFKLKTFQLFTTFRFGTKQEIHLKVKVGNNTNDYILQPHQPGIKKCHYVEKLKSRIKACFKGMKKFTILYDDLKLFKLDLNATIEL